MVRASEPVQTDDEVAPALPSAVPDRTGHEAVEAIVRAYSMLEHQATLLRGQLRDSGSNLDPQTGRLGPRLRSACPPLGTAAPALAAEDDDPPADREALIAKAKMILSAMAAGDGAAKRERPEYERRGGRFSRRRFEAPALLRLWADGEGGEPWFLYTRDAEPRGLGFVTPDRLPLGYGGSLAVTVPDGRSLQLDVTLVRCTACSGGWYQGGLTFVRPQHVFAELLDLNV